MRSSRLGFLTLGVFLFAAAVFGRPVPNQGNAARPAGSSSKESTPFEPLEKWRAAVLAGDKAALAALEPLAIEAGAMKCIAVTGAGHHSPASLSAAGADLVVTSLQQVSVPMVRHILG